MDVLHHALEVHERPIDYADLVAALEHRLGLGLLRARFHLPQDLVDLVLGQRDRARARSHEAGDLRGGAHELPRLVRQLHLHQHVARKELLLGLALLLVADLHHLLGGDEDADDPLPHAEDLGARLDRLGHLVLEARVRVDDVPLLRRGRRGLSTHRRILSTMRASPMSTAPRKNASTTVTTITTVVELMSSCRLGQVTFLNSTITSLTNSCARLTNSTATAPRSSARPVRAPEGGRGPPPGCGRGGGIRTPIARIWSPVL